MIKNKIIVALFFFAACQSTKQESKPETDSSAIASPETPVAGMIPNQLTEEQVAEGWELLFNGKDTEGWRFYKGKENDSWEVVDGTLHCKPAAAATKRADLMTVNQYENFELSFDWKIAEKGNSGVMYRVTEEFNEPYLSGPEYQVIDDKGYPNEVRDTQTTGSNYDMHAAPTGKPINPVGEWNNSKIVVTGNKVQHWLNGVQLFEYELGSDDWKQRKAGSKWKDAAGYGMAQKGHIDFQDHGTEAWFRNIKIKNL
ncbi:3-keto-disaccharide hydrolase [Chryseosolibacter indicus]|uniref:DUF1080 domain-containing protein n=1 Tax=Chryseosolibacter indicus TaxID=2782351 RepID=A0ABS5VYJ6_9BACT|nr:DUF1080 domain-containing protein [Chryseosolibacter indicus]MBT1705922.1 DUF1080 domain-containing protein [Chryseosolibacter indicus]